MLVSISSALRTSSTVADGFVMTWGHAIILVDSPICSMVPSVHSLIFHKFLLFLLQGGTGILIRDQARRTIAVLDVLYLI